jgi:hypothetical protein
MRARKFAGRAKSFAKRKVGLGLLGEKKLRLARQTINEKNVRLSKLREQMGKKDREISHLRSKAEATRSTEAAMPVFFIVGFAKSGTSWLMRTLNYHPEILCTGEGLFFGRGTDLDKRRGTLAPSSLYGVFADSENLRIWLQRSAWTRGDDVDEHINNLARRAMDYVFRYKLAKIGKNSKWIVGDKTPFVSDRNIEEINLIYPEAKVIHIIRDGRDVTVSAVHHMWNYAIDAGGHLTVKPEEVATRDAYREDPEAFLASGRSIFDENRLRNGFAKSWHEMTAKAIEDGPALLGENYAEVRYEDLLERPEEEVGRLLRFLGADDASETVQRCIEKASFESWTKGRERGHEESTAFLRKGVAGDWENVFTERDKEIFKEVAGDLLIKLGYEKDGDW